jgi:hypothetical protein
MGESGGAHGREGLRVLALTAYDPRLAHLRRIRMRLASNTIRSTPASEHEIDLPATA